MIHDRTSETDDEDDLSVVDRVFAAFTKSVGEEEGYGEIAKRLKQMLLDKREMSEAALERALFGTEQ